MLTVQQWCVFACVRATFSTLVTISIVHPNSVPMLASQRDVYSVVAGYNINAETTNCSRAKSTGETTEKKQTIIRKKENDGSTKY